MNSKLASGDNSVTPRSSPREVETVRSDSADDNTLSEEKHQGEHAVERDEDVTPQTIDDNELKLKTRIAQCKSIIESLKLQLSEEKAKLKTEKKEPQVGTPHRVPESCYNDTAAQNTGTTSMYSACVDSKLYCDESLMEYEKQLQRYQNTLNMAQNEKKNAIRKQMIAKAFKLKLMEVENQCNIELLRVKQSLQCLEPLQIIANKWKTNPEEAFYDVNSYDLMPNFLELKAHSVCDVNSFKDESRQNMTTDNESALSD